MVRIGVSGHYFWWDYVIIKDYIIESVKVNLINLKDTSNFEEFEMFLNPRYTYYQAWLNIWYVVDGLKKYYNCIYDK